MPSRSPRELVVQPDTLLGVAVEKVYLHATHTLLRQTRKPRLPLVLREEIPMVEPHKDPYRLTSGRTD